MCRLSRNLGASTSWNPVGLSRSVMGLLFYTFRTMRLSLRNSCKFVNGINKICIKFLIPVHNVDKLHRISQCVLCVGFPALHIVLKHLVSYLECVLIKAHLYWYMHKNTIRLNLWWLPSVVQTSRTEVMKCNGYPYMNMDFDVSVSVEWISTFNYSDVWIRV
jgi:hypothetical protein